MAARGATLKTSARRSIITRRKAFIAASVRVAPAEGLGPRPLAHTFGSRPFSLGLLALPRNANCSYWASKGQKIETDKRPLRHVARFILNRPLHRHPCGCHRDRLTLRAAGKSFVDLENGIFHRLAIGKRATTKRQTPVPLPGRLLAHLRRWSRLGIAKSHFVEWNGKPVASVKTGFASAVRLAGLDVGTGNVTPHTLRHTAATWLMQRGAPMWEAAGFLGMSEKTLRETYGHHHPDLLRGAADAIAARPAPKKVALVVSLVEEKAKRQAVSQALEITGGPGRTRTCNQTVMSGRL